MMIDELDYTGGGDQKNGSASRVRPDDEPFILVLPAERKTPTITKGNPKIRIALLDQSE